MGRSRMVRPLSAPEARSSAPLGAAQSTGSGTRRLDGLQVLRGIAATMVVADHAMRAAILQGHAFAGLETFAGTMGRMAVNIFFVLSGFIMTYTTRATAALPPRVRVRRFVRRRVARLVPLYWLATAVTLVLGALAGTRYAIGHIVTSLLLLPNVADSGDWRMPPIVGVGWTLTYESLFYAIFAASLLAPRKIGLGLCVGAIALLVEGGSVASRHIAAQPWHRLLVFYAFRNMAFFAIGITLAVAVRYQPRHAAFALERALALVVLALAAYLALGLTDGSQTWAAVSALSCTATVALAARSPPLPATPVNRALLHLGDASFSIYLFHALLLERLAAIIRGGMTDLRGGLFVATATVSAVLLGSAIHSGIERPLAALFNRTQRGGSVPEPRSGFRLRFDWGSPRGSP